MKHSKSDRGYFRNNKKQNSMKAGKLEEDGNLDTNDFGNKKRNNFKLKQNFELQEMSIPVMTMNNFDTNSINQNNVSKKLGNRPFRNMNTKNTFELQEMNNLKYKNRVKPIKIMRQKGTEEKFIFFGYNPELDKYKYVCNNNSRLSNNYIIKPIIFHKLKMDENNKNSIVELSGEEIMNIEIEELIILFYQFLLIRKENPKYMKILYKYLCDFVLPRINDLHFSNNEHHKIYKELVERINQMVT